MSCFGPSESQGKPEPAIPFPSPAPLEQQAVPLHPPTDPWALDPSRLPRSLAVDIPEPIWRELLRRSLESDRDLSEIALALIDQQLFLSVEAAPVQGSEGGRPPIGSPDSQSPEPSP
ncbi:MAG: hypothetical protein VKM01_00455 [Cyanobacteriota bacterium]|nr:hypothetical protein [Cyanobacteriota bacterium]